MFPRTIWHASQEGACAAIEARELAERVCWWPDALSEICIHPSDSLPRVGASNWLSFYQL